MAENEEIKTPEVTGLAEAPELTLSKAEKKALALSAQVDAPVSPRVSVGRIVMFHHKENDGTFDLAAMVTNVACIRPDTMIVCLTVFDAMGTTFGMQGIKEGTGPNEWSWPERV